MTEATESYIVSELLTVEEFATELRTTSRAVRRWVKEGRVDHVVLPSGQLRIPIDALPRRNRARLVDGHGRLDRRELEGVR